MRILGAIFLLIGAMGLVWFGIPAVIGLSELIASRTTGHPMPDERVKSVKDSLYRLSGSVVFAAAGFSLIQFADS